MPFRTGIGRLNFHGRLWTLARAIFAAALISAGGAQAATVQYVYDELGRLVAVVDPSADVTEYAYDEVGNLLSVSRRSSAQVSIISFSPSRGQVGQVVTIVGTAFSADVAQNQVRFNGTAASVTSATATSLVTTVPSGATTGLISVTTPSSTATSATAFIVRQLPQIASFSPAIGQPGGTLVLTGKGFDEPNLSVIVNKASSQVISAAPDTLTSRIPTATGGKISVTTELGTGATTDDLFVVPAPRTAAEVAATGRISIDGPSRVLALPAGKVGLVLFDGVAGSSGIRLSLRDVTLTSATFSVFKPDGTAIATAIGFSAAGAGVLLPSLPATGTYGLLVVADAAASGSVTVAATTGSADTLSVGDTTVVSLTAGQVGRFTFQGAVGQNLGLDLTNVTLPSGSVLQVVRPDGVVVVNQGIPQGSGLGARIPGPTQAGTYTVLIIPPANGTGNAQLTLWSDVSGVLELGVPKTTATVFRQQSARLTFSGAAGDNMGLEFKNVTFPSGGTFSVLRPDGAVLIINGVSAIGFNLGSDFSLRLGAGALPLSGTYTVVVTPGNGTPGSIQFTLWKDVSDSLTVGTPYPLTIQFRNQQARLPFDAATGQNLRIILSGVTLPAGSSLAVLRPDGVAVVNTSFGAAGITTDIPTLTSTGIHTVQIVPGNQGTGNAVVNVTNR